MRDELTVVLGATATPTPEPWMMAAQAPKADLFPLGLLPPHPWVEQRLPIQLIRIGDLALAAMPSETTIVAGLRIRRLVADALGLPLENVLLQGYANGYSQYTVTPEEYVAQQYEGGESLFGRWTLCGYMQEFHSMARSMARGDRSPAGRRIGEVVSKIPTTAAAGSTVAASFCGAYPTNRIRRGTGTAGYFAVERFTGTGWEVAYGDDHGSTEMKWVRPDGSGSASKVTVTWRVPRGSEPGDYRIRYYGDVRSPDGKLREITGATGRIKVG